MKVIERSEQQHGVDRLIGQVRMTRVGDRAVDQESGGRSSLAGLLDV
jgi:hypothetical protein